MRGVRDVRRSRQSLTSPRMSRQSLTSPRMSRQSRWSRTTCSAKGAGLERYRATTKAVCAGPPLFVQTARRSWSREALALLTLLCDLYVLCGFALKANPVRFCLASWRLPVL